MFGRGQGRRQGSGHGNGGGRGHGGGRGLGRGRRHRGCRRGSGATLDRVRAGEHVEITEIQDDVARAQAIRLGLGEGSPVKCVTKLPCGPVILKCGLQEIAVGRGLAERIGIRWDERLSDEPAASGADDMTSDAARTDGDDAEVDDGTQ